MSESISILKKLYMTLIAIVMFAWVGIALVVATKIMIVYYPNRPAWVNIAWISGSINLLLLSLTKNWSLTKW